MHAYILVIANSRDPRIVSKVLLAPRGSQSMCIYHRLTQVIVRFKECNCIYVRDRYHSNMANVARQPESVVRSLPDSRHDSIPSIPTNADRSAKRLGTESCLGRAATISLTCGANKNFQEIFDFFANSGVSILALGMSCLSFHQADGHGMSPNTRNPKRETLRFGTCSTIFSSSSQSCHTGRMDRSAASWNVMYCAIRGFGDALGKLPCGKRLFQIKRLP